MTPPESKQRCDVCDARTFSATALAFPMSQLLDDDSIANQARNAGLQRTCGEHARKLLQGDRDALAGLQCPQARPVAGCHLRTDGDGLSEHVVPDVEMQGLLEREIPAHSRRAPEIDRAAHPELIARMCPRIG